MQRRPALSSWRVTGSPNTLPISSGLTSEQGPWLDATVVGRGLEMVTLVALARSIPRSEAAKTAAIATHIAQMSAARFIENLPLSSRLLALAPLRRSLLVTRPPHASARSPGASQSIGDQRSRPPPV